MAHLTKVDLFIYLHEIFVSVFNILSCCFLKSNIVYIILFHFVANLCNFFPLAEVRLRH